MRDQVTRVDLSEKLQQSRSEAILSLPDEEAVTIAIAGLLDYIRQS